MRFTDQQKRAFMERGYLAIEGVFSTARVRELRDRTEWLREHWDSDEARRIRVMQEADIAGGTTAVKTAATVRKFAGLAPHEPLFRAWATDAGLLDLVEDLIGRPGAAMYLYDDQVFMKPPRVGSTKELHQDNGYFHVDPSDAVLTVWCALDDATVENGCMHYVPGSHRLGLLEHEPIPGTPHSVPRGIKPEQAVPVPVNAGGVICHHSLALHYSPPNHSDRWRRAFACHYARGGVKSPHKKYEDMIKVR